MLKLALHWQILIAMLLGAAIGLSLNIWASEYGSEEAPAEVKLPSGAILKVHDTADKTQITVVDAQGNDSQSYYITPEKTSEKAKAKAEQGFVVLGSLDELAAKDPKTYRQFHNYGRSTARIVGGVSQTLGGLFLRMLKMVSIPLIVTSLVTGVTGLGSAEQLGRMFGRTATYYVCTSLLAIITGLCMVNLVRPGVGAELNQAKVEHADHQDEAKSLSEVLYEQLERLIPTNPFAALAEGEFLSIIAFSIAIGVFILFVKGDAADHLRDVFRSGFAVMMLMTMAIIHLAPIGVLFLMLYATATQGAEVFQSLGWYMLTVILALGFHACIVLPLILKFIAKRSPLEFARAMSSALLTAFSSASSNATLPLTLTCVEQKAGVSNKVSSFVLPLGATVNMDGTALYEAVAVLFIAQMSGADLSLSQQIIVALTALLASVGAAGIPHAGLVMMVIILQAVGLPTESQGLIIAVDRILDMGRTAVNVWSDSCGCAVVARFEPETIAASDTPPEVAEAGASV